MSDPRRDAKEMRDRYVAAGDPTGWFEELYAKAGDDTGAIPWADLAPNPLLVEWLEREGVPPGPALKVGCGLGDDAELLVARGVAPVVAFDVAPSAVEACRRRFPDSRVEYEVADLFELPLDWTGRFAFVLEAYTLQVIPPVLQPAACAALARVLAPGGTLLVIARGRDEDTPVSGLHWPPTRAGLTPLLEAGLTEVRFEDFLDAEDPPVRRFRVTYQAPR